MAVKTLELTLEEYLQASLYGDSAHGLGRSSRRAENALRAWSGTRDWSESVALVEKGWEEGREYIDRIVSEVELSTLPVPLPQMVWDVTGDFVDIGKAVMGEPECMMRWESEEQRKPIAKIGFEIFASSGVSTEAMKWKGALAVALVDKLESAGIRVELDLILNVTGGEDTYVITVKAKRAEESLQLDTLAFHLAHPSSFRRVMFSYMETCEYWRGLGAHSGGFYGYPSRQKLEGYDAVIPQLGLDTLEECVKMVEQLFGQVCTAQNIYWQAEGEEGN
jgi:hypothetical protein